MQAPLISLLALERALSAQRLQAYRHPNDRDETDGLARYLWNQALVAALQPVLHTLEIAFRNELSRAATRITAGRRFQTARVPSWLDAMPTMLLDHEYAKLLRAKDKLGMDPRSQTEGHLIAKLDFGFWVALCRQPYDESRGDGPRLWPDALDLAFRRRPPEVTTRAEIWHMYDPIREFRNRVAHHEPIWDRDYLDQHERILRGIGWMSPKLEEATRALSAAEVVFTVGSSAYRPLAEAILGTGTAARDLLGRRTLLLNGPQRGVVVGLVNALLNAPDESPTAVAHRWATSASTVGVGESSNATAQPPASIE